MFTGILAPVDGCERAELILPYVEEVSNRLGAHITLLHVYPSRLRPQRESHLRYVEHLAVQARDRIRNAHVRVDGIALEGRPDQEIATYAAREDISLIAAAAHSQTTEGHWTIGRTAGKVIRATSKPVLLIRLGTGPSTATGEVLNRILVPLDGSRISRDVLTHVDAILGDATESCPGRIWLTHVVPSKHYATGPLIAKRIPHTRTELKDLEQQASRYLEEVATMLRKSGRNAETRVSVGDDAASSILQTSMEVGANLIAMTTHGHSGFSRLFLGSVAERVLHSTTTPLLMVRPATS